MLATPVVVVDAKGTEHLAELVVPSSGDRVQGFPPKVAPDAIPVWLNETVPAGVVAPIVEMSVTVAVQVDDSAVVIVDGVQVTVVVVALGFKTMIGALRFVDPSCVLSPLYQDGFGQGPGHEPCLIPTPEQLDHVALIEVSTQVTEPKPTEPVALKTGRSTSPVGGLAPVDATSFTYAVHVIGCPTKTVVGVQTTGGMNVG